jgi:hypothetical protein
MISGAERILFEINFLFSQNGRMWQIHVALKTAVNSCAAAPKMDFIRWEGMLAA